MARLQVRPAVAADASACAAIYAPYLLDTAITFATQVPTVEQIVDRIAEAPRTHDWLAFESDSDTIGYACAREFKSRAAYRWSVETSVYLELDSPRVSPGGLEEQCLARRHLDATRPRSC